MIGFPHPWLPLGLVSFGREGGCVLGSWQKLLPLHSALQWDRGGDSPGDLCGRSSRAAALSPGARCWNKIILKIPSNPSHPMTLSPQQPPAWPQMFTDVPLHFPGAECPGMSWEWRGRWQGRNGVSYLLQTLCWNCTSLHLLLPLVCDHGALP